MTGQNYYLLTVLPGLGALGDKPPLRLAEFLDLIGDAGRPSALVETILLGDDLLQRDAFLAGEIEDVTPTVLLPEQLRDEMPLPEFLAIGEAGPQNKVPSDNIWEAYFRYVAAEAREQHSTFLAEWVGFEVAMRNAAAEARARALELESADYLVAEEIGQTDTAFGPILNEWAAAANPMEAQRALDSARWRWLNEHDAYFSFGDDELVAYAAKLMLAERWYRLAEAAEQANA